MFANERYSEILKQLKEKGAVTTAALVSMMGVSVETVRRDLLALEKLGKLQRVHGGAVCIGEMKPFYDLHHRMEDNREAKAELSAIAAQFVENGDIIFIDAGSTAVFFAREVKSRLSKLTVVTYSLDVFDILKSKEGIEVILCAGSFMRGENAFYGKLTVDVLRTLHVNKAFIFPSAISLNFGIRDFNQELSAIQQCALGISEQIFVLADSNKFEKKALLKLDDMNCAHTYITDSGLSDEMQRMYAENGLNIVCKKGN